MALRVPCCTVFWHLRPASPCTCTFAMVLSLERVEWHHTRCDVDSGAGEGRLLAAMGLARSSASGCIKLRAYIWVVCDGASAPEYNACTFI